MLRASNLALRYCGGEHTRIVGRVEPSRDPTLEAMPRVEHGNVGSREVLYPTYDSGVFMPAIPEREVRDAEHREINAVREERSGGRPRQISARDEARRVMLPPHANNPNTQSLKFVVVDRRNLSPLGGGHDVRSGRGCAADRKAHV